MKKALLLCMLGTLLVAPRSFAGLDLAWNACNTNGGQLIGVFDCAGGTPSVLNGSWQVATNQDSVVSLDGRIDVANEFNPMPSFWQFDGCNSQGYEFSHTRPGSGCSGSFNTWSAAGSGETITYLPPGSPGVPLGNNRAVWLFTVFRPATNPINVPANRNNFGFALRFLTTAAAEGSSGGTCVGCQAGVRFIWESGVVGNVRTVGNTADYSIIGPGLTDNCVHANVNNPPCPDLPVRNTTWGQIKAFYH